MSRLNYLNPNREYTDKQKKFLEVYSQSLEIKQAAKEAQYTQVSPVVASLKDEIITIAENYLAINAGKAIDTVVSAMDADGVPQLAQRLDAAKTILDRIGIVKKDKIQVEANIEGGIFVLPAKVE
jgi:hypothetical protein